LTGEKLPAATALVEEQLNSKHIEPTHTPFNISIFVITKKSGRGRLLQDLRNVNRVKQPIGTPQPGLPSPTAISSDYCLCILDFKDSFLFLPFFFIQKTEKFAFTLSSPNHQGPGC
jgi:hypothetical protein